jgi:hypothetical protein
MSNKKDVIRSYHLVSQGDLAVGFDTFQKPSSIQFLDNASMVLKWTTAGTPDGEFEVYVSNDDANLLAQQYPQNWSKLDFGLPVVINSLVDNHAINMNQLPFTWLAVKYVPGVTPGTGLMDVYLSVKAV